MSWNNWIIDATMGYPLCFCPIEGDLDGEFSVVVGVNLLGSPPRDGKVIALLHEDGQEAADAFYEQHKAEIDEVLRAAFPRRPPVTDADYDDHFDGKECWQCGGEGRVNHCIDGCCVDQDDIYCEYCSGRCDICHPPTPEQVKRGNELRQILADALNGDVGGARDAG